MLQLQGRFEIVRDRRDSGCCGAHPLAQASCLSWVSGHADVVLYLPLQSHELALYFERIASVCWSAPGALLCVLFSVLLFQFERFTFGW